MGAAAAAAQRWLLRQALHSWAYGQRSCTAGRGQGTAQAAERPTRELEAPEGLQRDVPAQGTKLHCWPLLPNICARGHALLPARSAAESGQATHAEPTPGGTLCLSLTAHMDAINSHGCYQLTWMLSAHMDAINSHGCCRQHGDDGQAKPKPRAPAVQPAPLPLRIGGVVGGMRTAAVLQVCCRWRWKGAGQRAWQRARAGSVRGGMRPRAELAV